MLSLQHVTASVGPRVVLRDVSLDIGPGETVCVIGEEGSGKSTLLKLLTRELRPDEGVIKIDTAPLSQVPRGVLRLYRSRIGYLSENARLDPALTIERNVALPLDLKGVLAADRDRAVADLVKRLHLTGCAALRPHAVSRGERQLAAIARAIAAGPAIVLLDEPFQGLGPDASARAAGLLENMRKKGATVIVASSDPRVPGLFKHPRVAFLHRGKLAEEPRDAPARHPNVREIAEAATAGLVERSSAIVKPVDPDAVPEPEHAEQPAVRGKKKIKITSVGSL